MNLSFTLKGRGLYIRSRMKGGVAYESISHLEGSVAFINSRMKGGVAY